ncbi:dTDP-4-dehydrorhamnose reductase [Pseudoduganella flava]|uniref:dTDP-4-dehydrorhamnose reductase n=1 Tax=Pseudoduganella flava TaxID=871742 RepID=A0A562PCH8_9BURK|nr:sugar nucleotide-binding protein [Pseudoduganella flava]QGZ40169.1 sugar nucleotide-binding protein [Pseudoduganella flava]TWI42121.1 dTDP-4-dehydrorhamnose reductase [Pseudoduganella flava]
MTILLTGAGGLLGGELMRQAECRPLARSALDWREPRNNDALFDGIDVLVHAAANTNVEQCERDPATCYRDNLALTELLAQSAARRGKRMVFISSTGVYGAAAMTPYTEYEPAVPTTHHHRSKLLAEQSVLRICPDALVLRVGWLFGGPPENPKNFVARRIEEARAAGTTPLRSNAQQQGNPTYVGDVARRLLELLALGQAGIFNCVGEGVATRHAYVSEIVRLAGVDVPVLPADAAHFNRVARVSDNEAAVNWRSELAGLAPMPAWQDSLATYMNQLKV